MGLCECDVIGVFLRGYYFMYRVCDFIIDMIINAGRHRCDRVHDDTVRV